MDKSAASPRLRLVGTWSDPDVAASREHRQEIIRENRRAAQNPSLQTPDPWSDPRWTLAVRAQSQLQGTAMTPERRERVMRSARHLGIRPFDANVIIAVVQDHARRGRDLSEAVSTLDVLPDPRARARNATPPLLVRSAFARFALALAMAMVATALLIQWLMNT